VAESELGEVMRFLRAVFSVDENHRVFQEDVLRWKCFAPHPFWEGSRGYALRYKNQIAAFGCVVPCRFLTGSGVVASCNVIDWAASKAVPGAGILLYRHIQALAGTMINIYGSDDARKVLPTMGFRIGAEVHHYVRALRPWLHFRQTGWQDWKSPVRLARDYRDWARTAPTPAPSLTVRRVENFEGVADTAFPDPSVTHRVVCARTPESLGYFLKCPAAKLEAYLLEREAQIGYFLLSRVGGQCRIADLWIRSADEQDWAAAYAAATEAASKDPQTSEVTIAAQMPPPAYRHTHSEPVFLLDPDSRLQGRTDLSISLLENDGFYWSAHPVNDRL
jgi:hypothetical protein